MDSYTRLNTVYDHWEQYHRYILIDGIIYELMSRVLKVHNTMYCIGGSYSMIAHGIGLNREPHDIDIIVPWNMLDTIEQLIKWCPNTHLEYDEAKDRLHTSTYSRIAVRYKGYNIDILGSIYGELKDTVRPKYAQCYLDNLENIRRVKSLWKRDKDLGDIELIDKLLKIK